MEGLVTAYSGTSLTIGVDNYSGSGTFAAWNINLAGDPAPVSQTINGNTTGNSLSTFSTEYTSLVASASNPNTTTTNGNATVSRSGTLGALTVTLSGTPDNGTGTDSYAFIVMVTPAGGSQAATSNTCTIAETSTTCTSASSVALNAGDRVNVRIVPSNSPASLSVSSFSASFGTASVNPIQ
jgi:hypothetical protein